MLAPKSGADRARATIPPVGAADIGTCPRHDCWRDGVLVRLRVIELFRFESAKAAEMKMVFFSHS